MSRSEPALSADVEPAALTARIMAGTADLATPGLLASLRRMAIDKLAADMPKYPALAQARAQWETREGTA